MKITWEPTMLLWRMLHFCSYGSANKMPTSISGILPAYNRISTGTGKLKSLVNAINPPCLPFGEFMVTHIKEKNNEIWNIYY